MVFLNYYLFLMLMWHLSVSEYHTSVGRPFSHSLNNVLCFSLSPHQNGTVQCEAISCPPPQCPAGTVPAYVKGACCKECQREWSTLNLVTLLHSYNHGHNCTQTRTHARNSKTSTNTTRFRAHITPPPGLPDNWPGLLCVAKLPPNMPLEMGPTFCIYMDQSIIH